MRATVTLSLLMLLLSCNYSGRDKSFTAEQPFGIPGSDGTEIINCPAGTAYIYKEYIIYTIQNKDYPGHDIYVFSPAARPADPCGLDTGKAYYSITASGSGGAVFFSGLYGDNIFIDRGTGPSHRVIAVFDIGNKKFTLKGWEYSGASVEDGALTYFGRMDEADTPPDGIPCPEAVEWKEEGLGVVYERKYTFDLNTGTRKPSDEFRCSPVQ